jgi:hypothetical protein
MNNKTTATMALISLTILASGCMGQTQDTSPAPDNETDMNLTSSEWCQQNNHGEALREGCVNQEDLLGNVSGKAYYAADNPMINCADPQAYVCSE